MDLLLHKIQKCKLCKGEIPYEPRPILNFSKLSRILLVGQAPGIRAHETKTPWNDPSGDRLREWLGLSKEEFYDANVIAITPMGFCYPGKAKTGDKPPKPICSKTWMPEIIGHLTEVKYKILIGQYALKYFLDIEKPRTLTEIVKNWSQGKDGIFILPHPSPRNNIWLKKNPWFEMNILPQIKKEISKILKSNK